MDSKQKKRSILIVVIGALLVLGAIVLIPGEIIPAEEKSAVLDKDDQRTLYGQGDLRWIVEGVCTIDNIRLTMEADSTLDDVNAALSDFGRTAIIRKDRSISPAGQYFSITLTNIDSFEELDSLLEDLRGAENSKILDAVLYDFCPIPVIHGS